MIRIGIICPSEIAFRRFMPALKQAEKDIVFAGIGYARPEEWFGDVSKVSEETIKDQQEREREKAQTFIDAYGGKIYTGYQSLIESSDLDAIYLPLPPALHYKWAKLALERGKHVFVEKPSTTCLADTQELINIASEKGLALHENYMFVFHEQISAINEKVTGGEIGDVRLYRISFGFPRRDARDFRYNKSLGGGALLDAGGYTMKLATTLLGNEVKLKAASAGYVEGLEVDVYGSATIENEKGVVAQLAFGMDNDYKCELEIWGSYGTLITGRIMTAPNGFVPSFTIKRNQDYTNGTLPADDAFLKSIEHFGHCITDDNIRKANYKEMLLQESLVEDFKNLSHIKL